MLNTYLQQLTQLLSNPSAPSSLYSTTDLTTYINTSRLQLAGETECVRAQGTLPIIAENISYSFSSITLTNASTVGLGGVYNIRQAGYQSGTKTIYMGPRSYPWANLYWLQNGSSVVGAPSEWAQIMPGELGTIVINPTPDVNYTVNLDTVAVPVVLANDATPEAIPYPYTDAVSYFAAYYAYMSTQRQADADRMFARYQSFVSRAKQISVPNVLGPQFDQYMPPVSALPAQGGG